MIIQVQQIGTIYDYHARNISQDDIMRIPKNGSKFKEIEEK